MKAPKALWVIAAMVVFEGIGAGVNYLVQSMISGTQAKGMLFSPNSQTVYGAGLESKTRGSHGWVWAWETKTGRLLWKSRTENPTSPHAVSPDGKTLLTMSWYCNPALWDTATGKLRYQLEVEPQQDRSFPIYFTPDGKRIMGCFKTGIQVWDAPTGRRLAFWKLPKGKTDWPEKLVFTADGSKVLVTAARWGYRKEKDGAYVQLWDTRDGHVLKDFNKGSTVCAISPSGKKVAFMYTLREDSSNHHAQFWGVIYDVATDTMVAQSPEFSASFSVDALEFVSENSLLGQEDTRAYRGTTAEAFLWDIRKNKVSEQSVIAEDYFTTVSPNKRLKVVENRGGYKNRPPLGTIYDTTTDKKLCDLEGLAGHGETGK